jgi:Single Cache domain 2
MLRAVFAALAVLFAAALSSTATLAQVGQYGTPAEARAMLDKVAAGMKADKDATLSKISKGEAGFKDRDLYPYCIGPDGKYAAHPDPSRVGLVYKDVKDATGKAYGAEVIQHAEDGKIGEVEYVFPNPIDKKPTPKVGLYTKVAGYICVVGYYKH